MQEDIDATVANMDAVTEKVRHGVDVVYTSGLAFEEIAESVDETVRQMQQTSEVSRPQPALTRMAEDLQALIDKFRV